MGPMAAESGSESQSAAWGSDKSTDDACGRRPLEAKENAAITAPGTTCVCGCRVCSARVEVFARENARLMREIEVLKAKIRTLETSSSDSSSLTRKAPSPIGRVTPARRLNKDPDSTSADISNSLSDSSHRNFRSRRENSRTPTRQPLPEATTFPDINATPIARPLPRRANPSNPHSAFTRTVLPPITRSQIAQTSPERTISSDWRQSNVSSSAPMPRRNIQPYRQHANDLSWSDLEQGFIRAFDDRPHLTLMQQLLIKRPDFVRHSIERQQRIQQAAALRKTIHQRKVHTAALLVEDLIPLEDAIPVLREDPSRVHAFTPQSVRQRTERVYRNTNEFQNRQQQRQHEIDRAAARIIAYFSSEEQRRRLRHHH